MNTYLMILGRGLFGKRKSEINYGQNSHKIINALEVVLNTCLPDAKDI